MDTKLLLERLDGVGVDTKKALQRFMHNEELFLRFIRKLPQAVRFEEMRAALEDESEDFYMMAHNLKGTAANLEIEGLADCARALMVEYRSSGFTHKIKLRSLLKEAELESEKLIKLLREEQSGGDAV